MIWNKMCHIVTVCVFVFFFSCIVNLFIVIIIIIIEMNSNGFLPTLKKKNAINIKWFIEQFKNSIERKCAWIQQSDQLNLDCSEQIKEVIDFSEKADPHYIIFYIYMH